MAPKIEAQKSNKRKQPSSTTKGEKQKKPKVVISKIKNDQLSKRETRKKENPVRLPPKEKKSEQLSKQESRQRSKELTEARKKIRKPYYTLEQGSIRAIHLPFDSEWRFYRSKRSRAHHSDMELASLWEKMRRRNIGKDERAKLVTEALQKMKGKVPEIAGSHISSRVLQTCVKYCSDAERDAVYEEIRPHFLTLSCNNYAVHLLTKMLDNASKSQLPSLISLLHGHVAALLRHSVGSPVVEQAYRVGNATQKRTLLMELYSTELQFFKDMANVKETRLVDIIAKLGLKRSSVLRHMSIVLQPILEKGIVDHSIIHRALFEYLDIADKLSAEDIIKQLSGSLLVRMLHTKEGSRIGMLCVKHGSAKERKKLLKGMKGHVGKIALDPCGSLVLVSILSIVDDTKLVTKVVIRELQPILKQLVLEKGGRRPILQLLHPYSNRYFSPEELAYLNSSVPSLCSKAEKEANQAESADDGEGEIEEAKDDAKLSADEGDESMEPAEDDDLVEGGKKDPFVRRQELLLKSGLAENLVDVCIENAEEVLKSNFGREVLYEVAVGGFDGILHPTLDEKLTSLYEKVAAVAAEPKSDDSEHILENFHSSRTIRKLVLDCPDFASVLWERALKGKAEEWAQGHSCKVVAAFVESSDEKVRGLAKKELQPLIDGGRLKIPDAKPVEK